MIYVIIPVHNRIDATMECLSCLNNQKFKDFRVIIVDDGSTDGTSDLVNTKYPEVHILKGDGNLWWTGAMHLGVEYVLATAIENDYVLSLNNDTAFEDDYLDSLLAASNIYGRAMVGSAEIDYSNRNKVTYAGEWLDLKHYRFSVETQLAADNDIQCNEHVNVLPGRGMLIPVEAFSKTGNFDKAVFPHYIADYDFSLRAFNAGIKLVLSYKSIVYSKLNLTGISVKETRPLSLKEARLIFFSIRSDMNIIDHVRFIQRHCPFRYRYKNLVLILLEAMFRLKTMTPIRKILRRVSGKD